MRLSIGYQLGLPHEESFVDLIEDYRDAVAEVYVPWLAVPSGRSPIGGCNGRPEPWAEHRYADDLTRLKRMGIRLNLLYNANCYGGAAMSHALEREVIEVVEDLGRIAGGVDSLTTTSPAIAHMVKAHLPDLPVRASVNMKIGTVQGMQYLAHLFDEFCVQRDFNRDLEHLTALKEWADREGKRLTILVNSGCLSHCSGQTFHDNLVAHESAVAAADNIEGFLPYTCWNFLRDRANWPAVLQATWVRPEDLYRYDDLFPVVKLATRLHARPQMVIRAYATRRFAGNLLDLLEPGFSAAFAPWVLDNTRFPDDWFEHSAACSRHCHTCSYCADVLQQALVRLDGLSTYPRVKQGCVQ